MRTAFEAETAAYQDPSPPVITPCDRECKEFTRARADRRGRRFGAHHEAHPRRAVTVSDWPRSALRRSPPSWFAA